MCFSSWVYSVILILQLTFPTTKHLPYCRATKSIAISIAWYINTIITAFTSALTGALLASRALLKIAHRHGVTLNGMIPKDDKDTYFDEAASYILAFLGIWFQFKIHFDLPFPINLLLWPMEVAEYMMKWSITKST